MKYPKLLAAVCFLGATQAQATDFVLMGGLNLSSPRTALESTFPLSNFFGAIGGVGFDFHIAGNANVEPEMLYVTRRYGGFASMPTLMFPVLGRFETRYILAGVGPYLAAVLSETADGNAPGTLNGFNTLEYGGEIELGIKLPLTRRVTALIDGRVTRALTASYDQVTGSFYWGQIQAFLAMQIRIGKVSAYTYSLR